MLAIVTESLWRSRLVGAKSFVYGWCAQAVYLKDWSFLKRSQPRRLAAERLKLRSLGSTHISSRMNFFGRIGEPSLLPLDPSGAVSPAKMRSFDCECPVSS